MKEKQRGRHAPAFILLAIALEPNHGLGIFHKLQQIAPGNRLDTAIIYRKLNEMEKKGCIQSQWTASKAGPRKKVYHITEKGMKQLELYKIEIEYSMIRLQKFIDVYVNQVDQDHE